MKSKTPVMEKLFTVNEIAALLNQDPVTVSLKGLRGKIPGRVKLGGCVRFRESAIRAWIEEATAKESSRSL